MYPYFSIIISVYNRIVFLKSLMQNINSQTFTDYELIFIDNGSDDGSLEYLKKIKKNNYKILECPQKGTAFTRNKGILSATGKFVYILDTDNRMVSEHTLNSLYEITQKYQSTVYLFPNKDYYGNVISKSIIYNKKINLFQYLSLKGEFTILADTIWYKNNLNLEVSGSLNAFASYILFIPAINNQIFVSSFVSQIYNNLLAGRVSNIKINKSKSRGLLVYYKKIIQKFGIILFKSSKKHFLIYILKLASYFIIFYSIKLFFPFNKKF